MSKYDGVRKLLDVVSKDDGHFDYSSAEYCMIGIARKEGLMVEQPYGSDIPYMEFHGSQLDITPEQFYAIYCGHIELRHQYVNEASQASVEAHRIRMQDKEFCLNYVRSLVETWEAVDVAQSRREAVLSASTDYFTINELCDA